MLLVGFAGVLLAASSACSASSSPPVTARIETSWPAPDLVTQYLETVELEAPGSLFPFISFLCSHPHSTKLLRDPLSPLSQHRAQRLANAGVNPVFAPEGALKPAETFALLEASAMRSLLFRAKGVREGIRLALANRETSVLLEGMRGVWEECEAEIAAAFRGSGTSEPGEATTTAQMVLAEDEVEPSCESWIDVRGVKACSEDEFWDLLGAEQRDKTTPVELPDSIGSSSLPRLYPFDHVTPRVANLPRFVLYASPTSPSFARLFTFLFSLSNPKSASQSNPKAQAPTLAGAPSPTVPPPPRPRIPRLQFVLRWKPSAAAQAEQRKLVLGGYGAALDIKKSDYLVLDDRLASASNTGGKPAHDVLEIEGGTPAKMEAVKKGDVADLSVRTAQLILESEDPFSAFVNVTSAFPRLASHLPALVPDPDPHLLSEVSMNQMSSRLAMRPSFFFNGIPLSDAEIDPFALLRLMRKERQVLTDLLALSPRLSGADARDLLINGGPKAKASGGMRDRIDAEVLGELYDATDRDEGSHLILWWNDLEKDRRYKSWPTSVRDLLRPSYPGSMSQVAKNLNNVVFVLDLSQPVSLALISENIKSFVSRGVPIRFGVVPLVSPLGQEDAVETQLAQLLWYLTDAAGRGPAMSFLASLQKAANGKRVTPELARRKYEQLAARMAPMDGGELASYDEVQTGVGRHKASASHSRLNRARQYLRRLGVQLAGAQDVVEGESSAPVGSFFMNGAFFPLDDDFGQNLQRTLSLHTQFLQQEVYLQSLTDNTDAKSFFANLPTTHKRRNPFIFVSETNPLKVVNLAKAFDGIDRSFVHASYIEGASGEVNETTGHDIEAPPAIATLIVVTDFDTPAGAQLAKAALQLADKTTKLRVSFLHNPPSFDEAEHGYALSNAMWALHKEHKLGEVLPIELISWIELSLTPEGPEDGAGLSWQPENPLRDLVRKGVDKDQAFDALLWWEELQWLVAKLGFAPGENGLILNGRVVGPYPDGSFSLHDLRTLLSHELEKRIEPVVAAFNSSIIASMQHDRLLVSHTYNLATSIVGCAHLPDPAQGLFGAGPFERSRAYNALLSNHTAVIGSSERGALFEVAVIVDPATELAQRWAPIVKTLAGLNTTHVRLYLNPSLHVTEVPIKRFYEYTFEREPRFDASSGQEIQPGVRFEDVPGDVLVTFGVDAQKSWFAFPKTSVHDLDNIRLADLPDWSKAQGVEAVLELEALVVEGHAREVPSSRPPRGLQLELKSGSQPSAHEQRVDTTVMANLGYFQFKASPGLWRLGIRPGSKGADVFTMESTGAEGWKSGDVATSGDSFAVSTLEGLTLYPRFYRNPGHELTELLDESVSAGVAAKHESGGLVERLKSMLPFFGSSSGKDVVSTGKRADINVFTVASGLLYERMAFLMCVSVMRHTQHSVKFWFISNFLSPSFKAFIPHMAREYGFDFELVTYKWPHWLRGQKEKQRTIWGYKILFLDVLFPLELDRVIFVDSDQIVRADLKELVDLDLRGAPYAYAPMGDDRAEMDGYRFWKQGYWKNHLQGRPYHISALYVVDLDRFRQIAAGDRLRQQYQALSADPNSLANLDQDLPNQSWREIPIYTLPQEWLWCETWCSDESLAQAKTIDLCNNPATHEPKLQRARRLLPEWTVYDDEVAALAKRVLAEEDADSSSSSSSSSSAAAFKARAHELEQAVQQEQERESFVEEQAAGRASGDSESEREPQGEEGAQHRVKDEL